VIRTLENVMRRYGCSADAARIYMDLREEGHPVHAAELMAGLSDPPEPPERCQCGYPMPCSLNVPVGLCRAPIGPKE
jgi:hypothetical protein